MRTDVGSGRLDPRRRLGRLCSVEQVLRILDDRRSTQVGCRPEGATDTEASGERIDQPVDVLRRPELLIGQPKKKGFLPQFRGAFGNPANRPANGSTAQKFKPTTRGSSDSLGTAGHGPCSGSPDTHRGRSTDATEHTCEYSKLGQ